MARRFEKDDVVIPRRYLKDKDWRASTISEHDEEPYIVTGAEIQVVDRGRRKKIKVYDIGSGSWTWNAPEYL
jgi:hypothetical protein